MVSVPTPGEYDWTIVANVTGRSATDTARITLTAPTGVVPCPPVGLAINTDTVIPMVGVLAAVANWAADGREGCGLAERFIFRVEADINYQIQFDVFGYEGNIPLGGRTLVIEGEGVDTGFRVSFGSFSFDNNTATFTEEVEISTRTDVRDVPTDYNIRYDSAPGAQTSAVRWARTGTVVQTPSGIIVTERGTVTRRGLPFGLSLNRVITAVRINVRAANSSGESAASTHSRSLGQREQALNFELRLTFVRIDGDRALFTSVVPPRLRDTTPDGRAVFQIVYAWDYQKGGRLDAFTGADAAAYGRDMLDASGNLSLPFPPGATSIRYQQGILTAWQQTGAGEVSGVVVGESNIVTVSR